MNVIPQFYRNLQSYRADSHAVDVWANIGESVIPNLAPFAQFSFLVTVGPVAVSVISITEQRFVIVKRVQPL